VQVPVQYFYFFSLYFFLRSFQAGIQIFFTKFRAHFKILGARRLTLSKLDNEGPQILYAILQELVANPKWREEFVHFWLKSYILFLSTDSVNVNSAGYNNELSQSYRVQRILT